MFTYGGVVYVTDSTGRKEITSFPSSDKFSETSGTMTTDPVVIGSREVSSTEEIASSVNNDVVRQHVQQWTSHTVFVVDTSGSMRRDDVSGARCRSDAIWTAICRDYVASRLTTKVRRGEVAGAYTDVVSIVLMNDTATTIVTAESLDWSLYNKILEFQGLGRPTAKARRKLHPSHRGGQPAA